MAPNLTGKPSFARGECDNAKGECVGKNLIRTDFIVQNIYAYLIKEEYQFDSLSPANRWEETVMKELQEIADEFKSNYGNTLASLCAEMEVSDDTLGTALFGIANELFCDGITWSKIVSLFVFVAEIALHCLYQSFPESIVNVIYECFRILVQEKLKLWIDDHGGWDGVRTLSRSTDNNASEQLIDQGNTPHVGWAKNMLQNALRMIGTIAYFGNSNGESRL